MPTHTEPNIGDPERSAQQRVVNHFRDVLGYAYLGNWETREGNSNIEGSILREWLLKRGVEPAVADAAIWQLRKAADNTSHSLYERNKNTYALLRYGVKVKPGVGQPTVTVHLIDWARPDANSWGIAEEVTVVPNSSGSHTKRPDIVLYVNGIALGVIELKRSTVSVGEGIRQNIGNQRREFIEGFFSTVQYLMAGNDSEGVRYGTIATPEKYYLAWKEDGAGDAASGLLISQLTQLCGKARFLEFIHDFIVFDAGTKKLSRPNQYFGVKAAQRHVRDGRGGIIWHTQGAGKSLTMVWLAQWIRENIPGSRVVVITDRTELDDQIRGVFEGVGETSIVRAKSGADLVELLNAPEPSLICSLIHKFGGKEDGEDVGDIAAFAEEVRRSLPPDFRAKGRIFTFVDECHRTQSGALHKAMKSILGEDAVLIGFTGTPLLKADRARSIEVFGGYIHTYRFNEAVADGVVLDLRYEARDIDQELVSPEKIDQWFEANTKGLNDIAKAELKRRWGTMRQVLSSRSRLARIASDILLDMATKPRLMSGRGNAMLVVNSIREACEVYDLFVKSGFEGKCAIVTSYQPTVADLKNEDSGMGKSERVRQYEIYGSMLSKHFSVPVDQATGRVEEFEKEVKRRFVKEPAQMKLLIVVDKLLTGFDAPPASYLYIDKDMRDHGLFQAICRVNRLDGEDKQYGYIVDYKDLFRQLKGAVSDYTAGALDGFDPEDVKGLLADRIKSARIDLEDAQEAVRALCEPVEAPRDQAAYFRYFCTTVPGDAAQLKANEPRRLDLYKLVGGLLRAFTAIANDLDEAGFTAAEAKKIRDEVTFYEELRASVKLNSGDAADLKQYEPHMRHLIDTYIRADESEKITDFGDLTLLQLVARDPEQAIGALPDEIAKRDEAVAETIENNVRRKIVDESPINPKYYERMSALLDALIEERRQGMVKYREYLMKLQELVKRVLDGGASSVYPSEINTAGRRALYDNLDKDLGLALRVEEAVLVARQDGWRENLIKTRRVRLALREVLGDDEALAEKILGIVKAQNEY